MANFDNESSLEDNSNTRDTDTDQHVSDSLDLSDLNNLSKAGNQGMLLLQRLHQLKVRFSNLKKDKLKPLNVVSSTIWIVHFVKQTKSEGLGLIM